MEEVYHVFTRSIANFRIFNTDDDFSRMQDVIQYYQAETAPVSFSQIDRFSKNSKSLPEAAVHAGRTEKLVEILAYCLMPTHVHLLLWQQDDLGVSKFMGKVLNSYTRYFNLKHKRKGPLWEGRFKKVLVESDEQLLHLTRYIHLNPVTACLVDRPQDWPASSYHEYVSPGSGSGMCNHGQFNDTTPVAYRKFVEDRIAYQRDLAKIKELLFEETKLLQPRRLDSVGARGKVNG